MTLFVIWGTVFIIGFFTALFVIEMEKTDPRVYEEQRLSRSDRILLFFIIVLWPLGAVVGLSIGVYYVGKLIWKFFTEA